MHFSHSQHFICKICVVCVWFFILENCIIDALHHPSSVPQWSYAKFKLNVTIRVIYSAKPLSQQNSNMPTGMAFVVHSIKWKLQLNERPWSIPFSILINVCHFQSKRLHLNKKKSMRFNFRSYFTFLPSCNVILAFIFFLDFLFQSLNEMKKKTHPIYGAIKP